MSLQTGTELICLALLFNKAIGVYGLLAILTGYSLSAIQIWMNMWSLLVALALLYLIPHIRRQSPFENLGLAWIYVIDTFVNLAFTTAFAVAWYNTAHDPNGPAGKETAPDPAGGPDAKLDDDQAAQAQAGVGPQEAVTSLVLIVLFNLLRIYFSLIVMASTRTAIQKFAEAESGRGEAGNQQLSPNPFAEGSALGGGWGGRLGRTMISPHPSYWLARKEDEEWTKDVSAKFKSSTA